MSRPRMRKEVNGMAFDVTCVESMQWNRTAPVGSLELSEQDIADQPAQISPEIMAEVQAAISAEVAKTAS